jgi:hypothetical protein
MAKSTEYYFIQCKVSPGLFATERQVVIKLPDGREFVSFVDERNVKVKGNQELKLDHPVDGWVRVFPVEVKKNKALVDLPQGSFTEGPRIQVPVTELIQP